jgi:hypothetical protein
MARSAPWPARWSVEYRTSVGTRAASRCSTGPVPRERDAPPRAPRARRRRTARAAGIRAHHDVRGSALYRRWRRQPPSGVGLDDRPAVDATPRSDGSAASANT